MLMAPLKPSRATDSSYGSVRFAIPHHALRFYFPALWPEAEQDQALLEGELGLGSPSRGSHKRKHPG